ncbi:MAG: hypothetical protein KAS32_00695 [Candidatus Peribacteraceae bacterium]|nr:hypothetical protein [Candidatus Peribacteraceae bacterium]
MKISVPFCFLPNSEAQEFDTDTSYRSEFQINELKKVSERDDFAYFVTLAHKDGHWVVYDQEKSCQCPFVIMWYDKTGQTWVGRIGRKRMLRDWHIVKSTVEPVPVELDDVVYQVRCK